MISAHTIAQRKYRARKSLDGYQRFDVLIPPDLWARLAPRLENYCPGYPGKSIVELLKNIEFSDE